MHRRPHPAVLAAPVAPAAAPPVLADAVSASVELALLVGVAITLAALLAVLAVAVAAEGGRLGRLGIDRLAASDPRCRRGPAARPDEDAATRRLASAGDGSPSAAADPWREAGRRVAVATGSP